MTNISKNVLAQKDMDRLFDQLNVITSKLDKRLSRSFFDNLLGPEEKIMLVKRLAAVVMLIERNSSYRVWKSLKISPTTAEYIRKDYENGRYVDIEKIITKDKADYEKFWKTLEVVLRGGLPEMGKNRWKTGFGKDTI